MCICFFDSFINFSMRFSCPPQFRVLCLLLFYTFLCAASSDSLLVFYLWIWEYPLLLHPVMLPQHPLNILDEWNYIFLIIYSTLRIFFIYMLHIADHHIVKPSMFLLHIINCILGLIIKGQLSIDSVCSCRCNIKNTR